MKGKKILSNATMLLVAMATAMLCMLAGCKLGESKEGIAQLPEKASVILKPVTQINTEKVITVSGTLTADKTSPLGFLVPGKVNRIYVDEGDRVKKGTLLASLESDDYRHNLDIAEASLMKAKDAYERYEPLYKKGAFAEKNFIELKAGLTQAEAARNIARKALADTELYAPIPGTIGMKGIETGQLITPQTPAFSVVKTDLIYARLSVPESEIGYLKIGSDSDVMVAALEKQSFKGRVSMIGAVADERTRTYTVKIELQNPEYILKPGMIVQADIKTDMAVKNISVPGSAIVRDADNLTYVFIADSRKANAQRKRVTTGKALQNEIEIRSGLNPDDMVIVSGQNRLDDGMPIVIENAENVSEVRK